MARPLLERARRLGAVLARPRDLWLLLRILALATILPLLLRTLALPRLLRWLTPRPARSGAKAPEPEQVARLVRWVLGRNRWVYRPNCLKRSLLLFHFLRQAGEDVHLRIGVRCPGPLHAGATLDGHAWLDLGGAPYLEPQAAAIGSYRVTYRYPERGAAEPNP